MKSDRQTVIDMTRKFLTLWNAAVKNIKIFSIADNALIEAISNGIITTAQQNHASYKEFVGRNLFSFIDFINVDINGKNGLRASNSEWANKMESIVILYLQAITTISGIKIIDRFNHKVHVPKPWTGKQHSAEIALNLSSQKSIFAASPRKRVAISIDNKEHAPNLPPRKRKSP